MPIAAHSTGGHSTLALLAGIAILIWAFASATALLGWLSRQARRRLHRPRPGPTSQPLINRVRRRPGRVEKGPGAGAPDPAVSDPPPRPLERGADGPRDGTSGAVSPPSADSRLAGDARLPAIPGARCSPQTLKPLADDLDMSHRLAVAEARVAEALARLPSDRWLVERYVLIAGHRIPFLVLGETGVVTVWALSGPPIWRELPIPSHVASHVRQALPGYAGPVQVGICRALAPAGIEPRWWCRPGQPGAWVMGLDWLIRWIEHFGAEHGLGVADLQRLRELSKPQPGPVPRVSDVVPDLTSLIP